MDENFSSLCGPFNFIFTILYKFHAKVCLDYMLCINISIRIWWAAQVVQVQMREDDVTLHIWILSGDHSVFDKERKLIQSFIRHHTFHFTIPCLQKSGQRGRKKESDYNKRINLGEEVLEWFGYDDGRRVETG